MAKLKKKPERRVKDAAAPPEAAAPGPPDYPAQTPDADAEGAPLAFPIVAVGASAGGMQAFCQLLRNLPSDLKMAVVYIQHLAPRFSSLVEVLQRETKLPVVLAETGTLLEPSTVYAIPPNSSMTIRKGVLNLVPRKPDRPHMPVDEFFKSLAEDQGSRAIGVILSGSASDGTVGLRAIKAEGGITFAQDEASAEHNSMPRSAIAAGCVDVVQPPAGIARELTRIAQHPYVAHALSGKSQEALLSSDHALSTITNLLRKATGVDFTYYKTSTIKRRIARRMALNKVENADRYVAYLRTHPDELRSLFDDILINVTEFFRDSQTFEALKKHIFPKLFQNRARQEPVRIWVPGCSTGEEVYSLAIAMIEYLDQHATDFPIQIFATDVSERVLDQARAAIYPETIAHDVSPERLRRFFVKLQPGYQINKMIREMCVFAKQNIVKDPPFSRLDLISCRNVLIYLGPVLQRRVMPVFHYALKPSGYLVLGSSETIGSFSELFSVVDKTHKIYARKPVKSHMALDFAPPDTREVRPEPPRRGVEWSDPDVLHEADRVVLARFGPPGVLVDADMNILQFRGQTGAYLEPASGAATLNLFKMLREPLLVEVRNALHRARKEDAPVRREGLHVKYESGWRDFDLQVLPIKRLATKDRRYLVLFEEKKRAPAVADPKAGRGKAAASTTLQRDNERLRLELSATKEYLQSIIEEYEASNEELRSANEEIQSSNEELQSTNEELETAKEELQSANEELNTVNEELETRNLQLSQAGNDLLNLLANVSIPIVMLGNDLRIRRFTPVSEKILNLIPSDVGRPISDINFDINIPDLEKKLTDVIDNLTPQSVEVTDRNNRVFSLRIRPYRTEDNKIDGVVMVLVDLEGARTLPAADASEPAERAIDPEQVLRGTQASVRMQREHLRKYARSLLEAQEDERRRVSRELHDELNQRLAVLEMEFDRLRNHLPPPAETKRVLGNLRTAISQLSDDIRGIALQLHPSILDDLGLIAAVKSYCEQFSEREGITAEFRNNGVSPNLDQSSSVCLYRVIQESLRNVAKHSKARKATVTLLGIDASVNLSVKDDGIGFDPDSDGKRSGMGLRGMQERVSLQHGTFTLKTAPGKGTEIIVQLPMPGSADDPEQEKD